VRNRGNVKNLYDEAKQAAVESPALKQNLELLEKRGKTEGWPEDKIKQMKEGGAEEFIKGFIEGYIKGIHRVAKKMVSSGCINHYEISEMTDLSIEDVQEYYKTDL